MRKAGIVDYGMGNVASVFNALSAIGTDVCLINRPQMLCDVSHVILPGVGSFGDAMGLLRAGGWESALRQDVLDGGKPFLGICLGMQLLASKGTEHGQHSGLGWIPGDVILLDASDPCCRVPHIGWNEIEICSREGSYRSAASANPVFYFVHSFHFRPEDPSIVDGWCHHGVKFAASIRMRNIWAVQYHPEKSQRSGLTMLRDFMASEPRSHNT